jgi:hypothetical protein
LQIIIVQSPIRCMVLQANACGGRQRTSIRDYLRQLTPIVCSSCASFASGTNQVDLRTEVEGLGEGNDWNHVDLLADVPSMWKKLFRVARYC